jgi:hypothetical protein
MRRLYNKIMPWKGYKHFNSDIDAFYRDSDNWFLASVNNHKLDFDKLGDFRITRFIRDPRDLVISGYFYHKQGLERWSKIKGPRPGAWKMVNGNIPEGLQANESFSEYLQRLPLEEGIIAEIEFRKNHFESMSLWPEQDPRIKIFKYEDIIGNEKQIFRTIFDFFERPFLEKQLGLFLADKYSYGKIHRADRHIRNPAPGQYKEYFTERLNNYFNSRYETLIKKLGYPL